ncbi:HAD family hydrolase [Sciscionella sediminilitoris]|uniref:HAD family hydrolase n=1 Tax=Sciscionella sediminilitoris TaxID=1445613 RepID=UPI0004DF097F|nr:HAD family hydrolase [Sciscionella sp. SE31]
MIEAALIDFSGTLFRLDYTEDSLTAMLGEHAAAMDTDRKVELLRKLTAPVGEPKELTESELDDWRRRDLDPAAHRRANVAILEWSGLTPDEAVHLYEGMLQDANWHPYPDTAEALALLHEHGIPVAVVSNIAWDIRSCFELAGVDRFIDAYVLSFEHGVEKPDEEIFRIATGKLGVAPENALMIGDSEAADGGARTLGARFAKVEPLPTAQRPDALLRIVREELGR